MPNVLLLFGDICGQEVLQGTSWQNEVEAQAIKTIITMLMNGGVDQSQIGVVAPYKAQILLLRELFPRLRYPKLKIASVDSFQGSERDYIVMSCVRSGSTIGFLKDQRRLNVSITRARRGLAIVGNAATLNRHCKTWPRLFWYFKSFGAVMTESGRHSPLQFRTPPLSPDLMCEHFHLQFRAESSELSGQTMLTTSPSCRRG
jgi:regulator of nonsense transcripts 1